MLVLALPKGRILEANIYLLQKAGLLGEPIGEGRRLIIERPKENLKIILAKPSDVPTYVQYGVADLGIAGKDVLLETNLNSYELLDLKTAACRLSLCGLKEKEEAWTGMLSIATKYPAITAKYFLTKGKQVEIIKLNGSVELAPVLGLSNFIVDIVSTGTTLRENGLVEKEVVFDNITARLIANEASYNLKSLLIDNLVNRLANCI